MPPTVCSEWNQWVPKGSGVDFYVNSLCLKVKWGKGRHTEGNIAEGRRIEQRGMVEREFLRERGKFPDTECTVEPSQSGKQGSALQREYAWRGEHSSGNNKVVKSSSPQAPCMVHLDLMAGVLSLLLYLQYFVSERTPPIFLFSPAIYNPAFAICYFPLPLPLCSFSL